MRPDLALLGLLSEPRSPRTVSCRSPTGRCPPAPAALVAVRMRAWRAACPLFPTISLGHLAKSHSAMADTMVSCAGSVGAGQDAASPRHHRTCLVRSARAIEQQIYRPSTDAPSAARA